jgi:hypothetical protein
MANSDPSYLQNGINQGLILTFEYVGMKADARNYNDTSPKSVSFYAMLKSSFSDNYNSSWNTENVFGRMDPIVNFQNTQRSINLQWDIPAFSEAEAIENLRKVSLLVNFLYPTYTTKAFNINQGDSQVKANFSDINTPPILRLKFGNLIKDVRTGGGLYGFIDGGMNVNFLIDHGVYIVGDRNPQTNVVSRSSGDIVIQRDKTNMYPKVIELAVSFKVIHNHRLGWESEYSDGEVSDNANLFPYGLDRNERLNKDSISAYNNKLSGLGEQNKTDATYLIEEASRQQYYYGDESQTTEDSNILKRKEIESKFLRSFLGFDPRK